MVYRRRPLSRFVLGSAATLVALVATACGTDHPGPTMPSGPAGSPPSSVATPRTAQTRSSPALPRQTAQEAALRTRLADALRPEDPVSARLVADVTTQLTVLDTDWLPGWQVVDVLARFMPHGQRFFVGLSEDGRARYLSGNQANFSAMVRDARIRATAGTVVPLSRTFLDATRTFQRYSYRIDEVGAIRWRADLTPAEQQVRDQVEQTYGHTVRAPRATPAGAGWTLTAWMVDGDALVRHDLAVAADGTTTDRPEVVVRRLPVPVSV